MSGRWKGLLGRLFGRTKRTTPSADMTLAPKALLEATITYILETARTRATGRSTGAQFFISTRDLRQGMVIDPDTMADAIKSRAKKYGLFAGRTVNGKQYFEKM